MVNLNFFIFFILMQSFILFISHIMCLEEGRQNLLKNSEIIIWPHSNN